MLQDFVALLLVLFGCLVVVGVLAFARRRRGPDSWVEAGEYTEVQTATRARRNIHNMLRTLGGPVWTSSEQLRADLDALITSLCESKLVARGRRRQDDFKGAREMEDIVMSALKKIAAVEQDVLRSVQAGERVAYQHLRDILRGRVEGFDPAVVHGVVPPVAPEAPEQVPAPEPDPAAEKAPPETPPGTKTRRPRMKRNVEGGDPAAPTETPAND